MTDRQTAIRLRAGSQIGSYKIQRLVNRSPLTAVYRAQHLKTNRDVAFKVFQPAGPLTADLTTRFRQEVQAIATLKHPNITRLYDYDVYRNTYYFVVLEWVPGISLRDTLSARPMGLERDDTDRLFSQLASAIASAHDQNVVHGNIKPDNVLLDTGQRPVLTDFLISCLVPPKNETARAQPMRNHVYLPPEQRRSESLTPASDVYALGVLLYEMLTGNVPLKAKSSLASDRLEEPPELVLPSHIRVELDPRIDQVVLKALSPAPSERFASVREMIAALEQRVVATADYETLPLTRPSVEQVRRSRSEKRRFERSRVIEVMPVTTPDPAPIKPPCAEAQPSVQTVVMIALAIVLLAILMMVLAR